MEWIIGVWVLIIFLMSWWFLCGSMKKEKEINNMVVTKGKVVIPKGNSGWPLIGETLDYIASGYSSCPVTFLEKRKSL